MNVARKGLGMRAERSRTIEACPRCGWGVIAELIVIDEMITVTKGRCPKCGARIREIS